LANYKKHIISYGETLQSIAQDELGDWTQWYSIAQLNNLKYPYIADTVAQKNAGSNMVMMGDTILINLPDTMNQSDLVASLATMSTFDQDELIALALGKDIDIMPLTNSVNSAPGLSSQTFEMKGVNGSLKLVKGLDNLRQSLFIRLMTPKGSYLGHPEYGSMMDMYIGMKNTEENAQLLDLEIQRTIWTDGRVTNVIFNGHSISSNSYTASFTVYTMTTEQAFDFVVNAQANGPVVLLDNFNTSPLGG
jgi:hypothetical protein